MTDKELFIQMISEEAPRFERVFKALPVDKLDYKNPADPKGKTALELACTIACETSTFSTFIETGVIDMDTVAWNSCKDISTVMAVANQGFEKAKSSATGTSEDLWSTEAKMIIGGNEVWKSTRREMAWGLLFDLIHHRGQLSTLIRPMGGKVPSIYGPSADETGS